MTPPASRAVLNAIVELRTVSCADAPPSPPKLMIPPPSPPPSVARVGIDQAVLDQHAAVAVGDAAAAVGEPVGHPHAVEHDGRALAADGAAVEPAHVRCAPAPQRDAADGRAGRVDLEHPRLAILVADDAGRPRTRSGERHVAGHLERAQRQVVGAGGDRDRVGARVVERAGQRLADARAGRAVAHARHVGGPIDRVRLGVRGRRSGSRGDHRREDHPCPAHPVTAFDLPASSERRA